jgi:hypothetical protein
MTDFRPMRRIRQLLTDEEAKKILASGTHGVLAVSGDNNYPYAVPLSYVYADGSLYFHSAVQGHKVDALRCNPKASFCVVERDEIRPAEYTTYFRSVIAFGRVSILESDEEKTAALRQLGERYHPGHPASAQQEAEKSLSRVLVLRMDIDHLTGKQAIELVNKATHDSTGMS